MTRRMASFRRSGVRFLAAFVVLLAARLPVTAHDSPEHRITELSALIKARPDSAYYLFLRAIEYRTLGRLERAASDLETALRQRTNYVAAWGELGRIRLAQQQPRAALVAVDRALAGAAEDDDSPGLHALRAEIDLALGRDDDALADCQKAVAAGVDDIESYLLRARLQARLGRFREAARGLHDGWQTTRSVVLKEEWIDALLDAGDATAAAPVVTEGLAGSRLRSAWLLRRARLQQLQGNAAAARADLEAVLESLQPGIRRPAPDVALVVNHALASALLGNHEIARKDLERATTLGADAAATDRVRRILREAPSRPTLPADRAATR